MTKVLIVDDNLPNRKLLRGMLLCFKFDKIFEANDGIDAIDVFKKSQPDIILMDIDMPIMDGYKAAKEIKILSKDSYVPIIFITASTEESSLYKALDCGGDDFLSKPFKAAVLESKIRAHLRIRQLNCEINKHDSLTGLTNREGLLTSLKEFLEKTFSEERKYSLFFLGGDRFKHINDNYGHLLGDKLLIAISERLAEMLPNTSFLYRLGGDEFIIISEKIIAPEEVKIFSETLIETFVKPFVIGGLIIDFRVSIGMLIFDNEYKLPTQILRNANIALRRAKDRGRGTYQMFDEEMLQLTLEKAALESDLKKAFKLKQFSVVFQPIIEIATGNLMSFEILLRWKHPIRGMIPPDKFIPIAEALGLIFEIGLWVLEKACLQIKNWEANEEVVSLPSVAVNLSPLQLGQTDFLPKIDHVFEKTHVEKSHIKFEITETAVMESSDTAIQVLESLRERNIELAIDDFGTGYSSLSYLDKLPVQQLKIDRSFVNELTAASGSTDNTHEIVRATIALAHTLKMRVVAEGIETQGQMDCLSTYECDYGQGYMIARPLSPEAATEFLLASKVQSTR